MGTKSVLRLILGDQLNGSHSWFASNQEGVVYVMMEIRQETDYVQHHIQKLIAFFGAMRQFANTLSAKGLQVLYLRLDDPDNRQSLTDNLRHILHRDGFTQFEYLQPDEYRLDVQLKRFCEALEIPSYVYDSEHFLATRDELGNFFAGKKQYLMESFYRYMRKKHEVLMEGKAPFGNRWNYDAENRKRLPANVQIPLPKLFERDVTDIHEMILRAGVVSLGGVDPHRFLWPLTRADSLALLDFFIEKCLPYFGMYQDAMAQEHWSLFHSRLSFSLNIKLLSPREVIGAAIQAWETSSGEIDIAQVEGFVRQILGWREYMRGVYWAKMPEYALMNYFGQQRSLPGWFWTGETRMNCLRQAINQSLQYAYAHHIQRLMITGNFALLAGIDPAEVDRWYLGIYIDAIEWVEITNTRGMSQFADGGIVGTKPYVSSANYIDKMSDYCGTCYYNKKARTGVQACPFNSLYWHFYYRNRSLLQKNPRIGMMYPIWDKMQATEQNAILIQAERYLNEIETL